ncbi:MAG: hypothetical protein KGI79_00900 [Patescibacteria group bacterium]|nr:hypothetical protein [Patescibacteria group bacterium]MDE2116421.1 hypothetical protein [Patescibacteria group bacterium]
MTNITRDVTLLIVNVLLIETDDAVVDVVKRMLERRGHQAIVAHTTEQALELLPEADVDLAIVSQDDLVGNVNAALFSFVLRAARPKLPIILVDVVDGQRYAVGAVRIYKPIGLDDLSMAIHCAVDAAATAG